jgi:hypothetical protein
MMSSFSDYINNIQRFHPYCQLEISINKGFIMFIYVIGTDTQQKIGISQNPQKRVKQLQTGNHSNLTLHHTIEVPDHRAEVIERHMHKEMSHKKLKGEWFNMTKDEAVDYLIFSGIRWVDDPLLYNVL